MPIFLTTGLLLGTAAAMAGLRWWRPRLRFVWLFALAASVLAWITALLWPLQLPISAEILLWKSVNSGHSFATFSAGLRSWPYALSLTTAALVVLLTAAARSNFPSPFRWAICLSIFGLGLLAVTAGSPLTLVLLWAGLDLLDAGATLGRAETSPTASRVAFSFGARLGSMGLAILGFVLGAESQDAAGVNTLVGSAALLIVAAALLRLWAFAFPRHATSASEPNEVEVTLDLVDGVSAIAFLSQIQISPDQSSAGLLLLCSLSALFAGWMWLRAPNLGSGRPFWIMGMGSLAAAAALRGTALGPGGWGNALLLAGSSLFLSFPRERWLSRLLPAGLFILSALPFSLSATGFVGGGGSLDFALPILLVAQGMLLAGYLHWSARFAAVREELSPNPMLRPIYRLGIILPLAVGVALGPWGWQGAQSLGAPAASLIGIVLAGALWRLKGRLMILNPVEAHWFPPNWQQMLRQVLRPLRLVEEALRRLSDAFIYTIEGEAGLMWSFLILVLLISAIVGSGR